MPAAKSEMRKMLPEPTLRAPQVEAMKYCKRPLGVDLFCGAGGMSLGFEQAGFDIAAAVDVEQRNVDTHALNFPNCSGHCLDVSELSGAQLRKDSGMGNAQISAVFGGPPCQGFSMIGKRRQSDPRNQLIREFGRLVVELSPTYFVMENVTGLLVGDARKTLDDFTTQMETSGFSVVQPIQVLDAAEYGVPQRRRRVFVLGYSRGAMVPGYPIASHPYDQDGEPTGPTVWDAIGDLPKVSQYPYLLNSDNFLGTLGAPSEFASILRGEIPDSKDYAHKRHTNGDGLSGCLRTLHTPETILRFSQTKPGASEAISRYYRLNRTGLAPTQRAGTGPKLGSFMAPRPIHPSQDRCITVREAARLHSFPDWFHFHATKWHGFRQIGNSVPPFLARAVARSILRAANHGTKG
jgi:DNA (cytosine-5)-methyltransferase 1